MSTMALKNSVFMHLKGSESNAISYALIFAKSVTYDYKYRIHDPFGKGYIYDHECKLYHMYNDKPRYLEPLGDDDTPFDQLLKEDLDKPKIFVITDPIIWYKSYWAEQFMDKWKDGKDKYCKNDGHVKFQTWIDNMLNDSVGKNEGAYTRYVKRFVKNQTEGLYPVRSESLGYDLHYALEMLDENWKPASYLRNFKPDISGNPKKLNITQEQSNMIDDMDGWICKFYY